MAQSDDCVVFRLRRSTMDELEREDPAAAVLLQTHGENSELHFFK